MCFVTEIAKSLAQGPCFLGRGEEGPACLLCSALINYTWLHSEAVEEQEGPTDLAEPQTGAASGPQSWLSTLDLF